MSASARAFLAAVSVAPDVVELRPDYRVLMMVAEHLEPGPADQISDELLTRAEHRARATLDGRAPEDVPQVAGWRAAYRAFGAKPQRTRPSVEALLRRLDAGLPRIDRLTDAYNAVSIAIANLVPVGGEDLDQYQGPARLVRATGDEAGSSLRGFCVFAPAIAGLVLVRFPAQAGTEHRALGSSRIRRR